MQVREYTLTFAQFPVEEQNELWMTLVQAWGPGLAQAVSALDFRTGDISFERLVQVVPLLFSQCTPKQTAALMKRILDSVQCAGAAKACMVNEVSNVVFHGDLLGYYRAVAKALEVNYRSFFDGAGASEAVSLLIAKFRLKTSQSPSNATGPSGDSGSMESH
jgi:hypothetical protein